MWAGRPGSDGSRWTGQEWQRMASNFNFPKAWGKPSSDLFKPKWEVFILNAWKARVIFVNVSRASPGHTSGTSELPHPWPRLEGLWHSSPPVSTSLRTKKFSSHFTCHAKQWEISKPYNRKIRVCWNKWLHSKFLYCQIWSKPSLPPSSLSPSFPPHLSSFLTLPPHLCWCPCTHRVCLLNNPALVSPSKNHPPQTLTPCISHGFYLPQMYLQWEKSPIHIPYFTEKETVHWFLSSLVSPEEALWYPISSGGLWLPGPSPSSSLSSHRPGSGVPIR